MQKYFNYGAKTPYDKLPTFVTAANYITDDQNDHDDHDTNNDVIYHDNDGDEDDSIMCSNEHSTISSAGLYSTVQSSAVQYSTILLSTAQNMNDEAQNNTNCNDE